MTLRRMRMVHYYLTLHLKIVFDMLHLISPATIQSVGHGGTRVILLVQFSITYSFQQLKCVLHLDSLLHII